MNKTDLLKIKEMLMESNAIEGVFDDDSLHQAELAWDYLINQDTLTSGVILKTHKILALHANLLPKHRGYFRDCEVTVGGRFGLGWEKVPNAIKEWCEMANESKTEEEIKQDHIKYETIHPFVDFNGRTGRMLMNWQRLKNGLPILVIKADERYAYYVWFKD